MSTTVRVQEPLALGNRKIFPVVAEISLTLEQGMMGSLLPLAFIIEEDGMFSYILLEGKSFSAVLEQIAGTAP